MDPRRLLLFAAVVEHRSVTRAASALHLSQPSLSRQLAALEREAGIRLLHRTPAGVAPTVAGERLLPRANAMRAQLDAARRELRELRGLEAGELRLVAFPSAAATLALDALRALRGQHPGLRVTIEERERESALERVRSGRADIALTFTDIAAPAPAAELETSLLLEEPMLLALAADHPRAGGRAPRLRELEHEPWIVGSDHGAPGLIVRACLRAGFEPQVAARLDNQPAIQAAVAARVGVTLIPALAARHVQPGVVLRPVAGASPSRRVLVHTGPAPHAPATDAGVAALRAAAGRAIAAAP